MFPRTNKTVRNDGGGGDWNGQAYFRDTVNDYFSFSCPWIIMYCKTVKVHSVKSELPKSSIVYKINWRKQSLIWPNDLNRTIARWRYLTTVFWCNFTHPTRGRDEMSITITLLFVQVFRDSWSWQDCCSWLCDEPPPPPFLLRPSNKEVSVLSGCP